jgi:FkbM family methyltransferase
MRYFIDCGAYDGCSTKKILKQYPDMNVVSYEPNPILWKYHESLPNTLVKKAVYTYTGTIEFIVDGTDGDGSSVIPEKIVDWNHNIPNTECEKLLVECEDIISIIDSIPIESEIHLKLDIEGAEYDVLNRIIDCGYLNKIHTLYCEFHWYKCGISKKVHDELLKKISIPIVQWDALEYAVHLR